MLFQFSIITICHSTCCLWWPTSMLFTLSSGSISHQCDFFSCWWWTMKNSMSPGSTLPRYIVVAQEVAGFQQIKLILHIHNSFAKSKSFTLIFTLGFWRFEPIVQPWTSPLPDALPAPPSQGKSPLFTFYSLWIALVDEPRPLQQDPAAW